MTDSATVVNQQNGGNDFDINKAFGEGIDLAKTGVTAYFSAQAAKAALKAPAANTGILVGGLVIGGILLVILLKKH